jgi:uroporphyrinogen decarboxylase
LLDAGAMGIAYGHAMASSSMISPVSYRKFSLPYEKRLVQALLDHGAQSVYTHICGNIEPIIDMVNTNGSTVIDFDHVMAVETVLARTPKVIRGNINPAVLVYGSAQQVYEQTKDLVLKSKGSNRLLVGSGCEIQKNTPLENLHAMVQAARDFGG